MSSILKVDTINDQNGNLIISKDSGGGGFLSPYASSSTPITYTVTVASKTAAHPYFGVGSSNGYFINGIESPIIEIKGNDTSKPYHYKFDQSDASNSGHPLLFYNNASKTTAFTTGVTTSGTPGQAGAYTMIAVDSDTPNILYYQCSSHANMGNHTFTTSPTINTGVFLKLPTTDGTADQVLKTNGSGTLSFGAGVTFPTITGISPSVATNSQTAITITGTNFQSIPFVDAINSSTGAIITADSVAFTNATTVVATFTISVDGTYFIRLENNDGLSVRSGSALLTVSDDPVWQTASGSLGSFGATASFGTITLTATDSTGMALQSGSFPGGMTLNTGTGSSTLTGTETGSSSTTTFTFVVRATDAQGQFADRSFNITISHESTGGGQFN